ncbi:MAG: hypothetical protein WC812_02825 [Candidatus Pacearchaeota archaeon]|jgi:hypothetical protein
MEEWLELVIGIVVLILGIPIGHFLAKATKEELNSRKNLFKIIIIFSLILSIICLIFQQDFLLFGFLFVAIVTSQNLNYALKKENIKNTKTFIKKKKNEKLKRKN